MPIRITSEDIISIAQGAAFLGSGGGGDVGPTIPLIEQLYGEKRLPYLSLFSLDELHDNQTVVCVGYAGAPFISLERLSSGKEWTALRELIPLQNALFAPVEIGGSNALSAILAALLLDTPIADADSLGRAFPTVDICSLHINEIEMTPIIISDEYGRVSRIESAQSAEELESLIREETVRRGSSSAITVRPLSKEEAQRGLIKGTVSQALRIGQTLQKARACYEISLEKALSKIIPTRLIAKGAVISIKAEVIDGFSIGMIQIHSDDQDEIIDLHFQNEFLVARSRRGQVVAATPDIISCIDSETKEPLSCEKVQWGQRVEVYASQSPDIWLQEKAYPLVRPERFGMIA